MKMGKEQQSFPDLERYDSCRLECDGLTRVLSYVLSNADIPHTVMLGEIIDRLTDNSFSPHLWIELADGRVVDYRARMWLGEAEYIPHGIFNLQDQQVEYIGKEVVFTDLDTIAPLLIQLECQEIL